VALRGCLEVLCELRVGEECTDTLYDVTEVDIKGMTVDNDLTAVEGRAARELGVNELIQLTDI
jgi:hypothetical protein